MPESQAAADSLVADDPNGWRLYEQDYGLPAVLEASLSAFVQFGYHGTSVRRIATGAGLSVPGLYHHYRNKADLLALLLDKSGEEVLSRARAALAAAENRPRSRLTNLVESVVLYVGYRQRLAHLQREMHFLDAVRFKRHAALRDQLESMVHEQIVLGHLEGAFNVSDPWAATRAILVLCRGVSDWYSSAGPQTPEQIAKQYVEFSLAILRASK